MVMFVSNPRALFAHLFVALALTLLIASPSMAAQSPFLAFSDLANGPDEGLGDGKGSGAIVTVWGQNLGGSQGDSVIYFVDSSGKRQEAVVYYWKNADGKSPSGPANLYESHKMQEIAFSVPQSASGAGEIVVSVDGTMSNPLPFIVRDGAIIHVKSSGNDNASGSWSDPFRTTDVAVNSVPAGSIIYVHDVDSGNFDNPGARAIYWNNDSATSSLNNQFVLTSYPGFQPKAIGQRAISSYKTEGMVVSKFDVYASNYLAVDSRGQPMGEPIDSISTYAILTSRDGRVIANRIGDIPGGCASKMQGAISGNKAFVGNNKLYGNEIYDYGCNGSSKLHHTTYLSIRSAPNDLQVEPWEWAYNYLHGNKAKFGIHQWDQRDGCGDLTGPLKIHNNVIVDQGGAAISLGTGCGWTADMYIENNVMINVGLAAAWDGVDPSTSDGPNGGGISIWDGPLYGTAYIRHNLIYNFNLDGTANAGALVLMGGSDNIQVVWENNIAYNEANLPFFGLGYNSSNKQDNVVGVSNIWVHPEPSLSNVSVPEWDKTSKLTSSKSFTVEGAILQKEGASETINTAIASGELKRDIYGNVRDSDPDIGPVEYIGAAPNPPGTVVIK